MGYPVPDGDRLATVVSRIVGTLQRAEASAWDDIALAKLDELMSQIAAACDTRDGEALRQTGIRLAAMVAANRYGSRIEEPATPSPRLPRQRINELVHRLSSLVPPPKQAER
jgi:hypothetical protein